MKQLKRVLIMAGGTGGHVFPGLAIAHYLRAQGVEIHWLGTQHGIEAELVPEAGIPLHVVTITGLRGKGVKSLLLAPLKILKAIRQSKQLINTINPDLAIGMGGYVSGPGGIACWQTRCPLIIHEQNAKAGLTNKVLAKIAKRVLAGFPTAFRPQFKAMTVGNPVRRELENLPPPSERFKTIHRPYRLLILGGSLGAQALNEMVPQALAKLTPSERPAVLHQTGDRFFTQTKKIYESMGIEGHLKPFVKDMAEAYSWADVVLCRAGALTVTELCTVGLGAIFVPYPYAVDDHQTANANFMVNEQAALCIQQSELTDTRLADIVRELYQSPEKRRRMAQAAYQLRLVNVAEKIYDICKEVAVELDI